MEQTDGICHWEIMPTFNIECCNLSLSSWVCHLFVSPSTAYLLLNIRARWWLQIFSMFTPEMGKSPILTNISDGLKSPTREMSSSLAFFIYQKYPGWIHEVFDPEIPEVDSESPRVSLPLGIAEFQFGKKSPSKGLNRTATVSNYGLRYLCRTNSWGNTNPAKCSFVPLFLFKLGSNLEKSKHHLRRANRKTTLWYWICVWDQGVFSKEWTRFLFKVCVFCSCCTWWNLHVAMWSGAPWNPHALCAGPKALHRNCCPCCTMLHRCEPHWVSPKKKRATCGKVFSI